MLNNKLLRVLQYKPSRFCIAELYKAYCTLSIHQLRDYQILLFMHKYVYNIFKLPSALLTYFDDNKLIRQYNARQKGDFHTYVVNTKSEKRSIKVKGSNLWNK